ncbi:MAG TPA: alpha/beta hydrolase [Thermoanaerobaculia bacterium]
MQANQLAQAIADAWDEIALALGDERDAFEVRLTPLLRQLEAPGAAEQAEAVEEILALFRSHPGADAVLRSIWAISTPTKGISPPPVPPGARPKKGRYCIVPVFYGTDRAVVGPLDAPSSYGPDRGELALGVAEVTIPDDHRMGKIERPSLWKLQFREDPEKHVMVWSLQPTPPDEFTARAKQVLSRGAKKEVLLFVHGYNVTFADAVMRTAQIAYDLHFEGLPTLYSWPSEGSLPRYAVDETNVTWSRPRFASFLNLLREQLGADTVHIIAHSMGNRLVTETLAAMPAAAASAAKLRQVVFTAPDIDAATFIDLAAAFRGKADRFTLYGSSRDKAILASKAFHRYPRAGESGVNLVVVDSVDTIDATAVDTSFLGHSYYGDNRSVVGDIFELIRRGSSPADRFGLTPMKRYGAQYWAFNP